MAINDAPTTRNCGAMEVHRRLLTESESYRTARAELENATIQLEAMGQRLTGTVTIPVVVHVVFNRAEQNISDEQIHTQIEVLNQDFRAANADITDVPAPFAAAVADAGIEFALATVDPEGHPTDGITRTRTRVASFGTDDAVKATATGGIDAWPADRYLNIWVAKLGGGLLGYAQFPGGSPATDGVVVTYTAFGTVGTATDPFDLGRTLTHEIGHWLNLFHIWGDDGSGCGGTDEVDDTPNQAGGNTGKPVFPHVTCNNGPHGDMFVNYMDYVDDDVMVMFTHGQVDRMRACLDVARRSVWQPARFAEGNGHVPVHTNGHEPSVVSSGSRIDVILQGADGVTYHKWFDGTAWEPSQTGWESIGHP
ncbi:zinc metalloprotease [Mycobacterium sp. MS1601]|uniref:zinc metalloprotease n=1 Tax=Mycobacterium sp. MS1601 TaxID=1936029 RepID=UPI0009795F48|nr:zinc metalloprotease [Mycobacterium sp. MS1601]AQA03077.1 zinc metalloprotease [Mycobacterium sp. MS1601]